MNLRIVLMVLVMGLLLACGCDSSGPGTPVLDLEREYISMELPQGSIDTQSFLLRNSGEGTLEIEDIKTTVRQDGIYVDWDWVTVVPGSLLIDAGGSSSVTLTADAAYQALGAHSGRLALSTNDPNNRSIIVPVDVEVTEPPPPDISVTPANGFNITLQAGDSTTLSLTVYNGGTVARDVTDVGVECSWVSASPDSLHLEPQTSGEISLSVRTDNLEEGQHNCVLTLLTTDPAARTITLSIFLTVEDSGGILRVVVAEEFTATWCVNCPGAMLGLHELKQQVGRDRLAVVAYHVNDEFLIEGNDSRAQFYNVIGIPDVWFDGILNREGGDPSIPLDYTAEYQSRVSVPASMTLDLSVSEYDSGSGAGRVNAELSNESDLPLDINLIMVLTGVDTTYSWEGQDHLYYTALDFIEGPDGVGFELLPSVLETVDSDFTVPSAWRGMSLEIVAMAQDAYTNEIHQGAVRTLP